MTVVQAWDGARIQRLLDMTGMEPIHLAVRLHIHPDTVQTWLADAHEPRPIAQRALERLEKRALAKQEAGR